MRSPLEGFPNCNQALPAGTPTEEYLFHQFLPLKRVQNAKSVSVGVPIEVAHPAFLQLAAEGFGESSATGLSEFRKPLAPFIVDWSNVTVPPIALPADVVIADVNATLLSGKVNYAGIDYDISGLGTINDSLRRRQPVVATLHSGSSTARLKLIPLAHSNCELPDRLKVTRDTVRDLVAGRRAFIPGIGSVDIAMTEGKGQALLREGFVTLAATVGGQQRELLIETADTSARSVDAVITARDPVPIKHLNSGSGVSGHHDWLNPEFVVYVPIRQTWKSDGYERGALINTFSLAPQEQITVEVFSWDRRKSERELTSGRETETSAEQTFSNKLTSEVVDKATAANGWKFGLNAGIQVPSTPINIGADFSIDQRNETAQTNTLSNIAEGVTKMASKTKSSVQTKITEAREYGNEQRVTRKFQNPNFGRVLHFDCFEVLHGYTVTTSYDFTAARLCLLLPGFDLLQGLNSADTLHRSSLLLGLEGLLFDMVPQRLQSGFEAARHLLAWDRICRYTCDSACVCVAPSSGAPASGAAAAGNPYQAELEAAMVTLQASIAALRGATGQKLASVVGFVDPVNLPGYLDRSPEDQLARRLDWFAFLFRRTVMEDGLSGFWSACIAFDADPTIANLQRLVDRLAPSIANMLNPGFAFGSIGLALIRHVLDAVTDFGLNLPFMMFYLGFEDYGLQSAATRTIMLYAQWKQVEDDKKKPPESAPASDAEKENPAADRRTQDPAFAPEELARATVNIDALVAYLQLNRSAFRAQLWTMLAPEDRQRYVNVHGNIGKLVQPAILGFVDDAIAVEVDESYSDAFAAWRREKLGIWKVAPIVIHDVILPVPGMTMQSRLEPCDALEPYLVESRQIELTRLRAAAAQAELETKRRATRMERDDWSDPSPASPPIRVETVPPTPK